jgi:hypothetical protein
MKDAMTELQDALIASKVAARVLEASSKKPLYGHTSPETAYVVDDYPYGFRLRCKIRYWVEFKAGKGYRFCSQTTNPKIADREVWNKPKASTYALVAACMFLDSSDHVEWSALTEYSEAEKCLEFLSDFPQYGDLKRLGDWAANKLGYVYKMYTGKAFHTINDVRQGISDADRGRYRAEAKVWTEVLKKCHMSYPDYIEKEMDF